MSEATDAEELLARLGTLTRELEQYPDSEVSEKVLEVMQIILNLHGEALRRMLEIVHSFPLNEQIHSRMSEDELVRAVLLIHELLPVELSTRVANAIDELRPFLLSHGCDVKLLSVENGRALLRLVRSGKGAPPIAALKLEIEKALDVAVPDLLEIDIEGTGEQVEAPAPLVQIKRRQIQTPPLNGTWVSIIRTFGFEDGQLQIINYADLNLLVCKFDGEFYAYRNACAAEPHGALDEARVDCPLLTCTCHGYSYNLQRAGACVEKPELRLQSLPSRVEDDKVKVAAG